MPKVSRPHRGSMQYWPRKRSRHTLARVRSWSTNSKAKLMGFIGIKAGMTHALVLDNKPKSLTKGEKIFMPLTIIECPPLLVAGVAFYSRAPYAQSSSNLQKIGSVLAEKPSKELNRVIPLPKKTAKKISDFQNYDDIRLLVQSQPGLTGIGNKKPQFMEVALGGSKEEKLAYAQNILGKEIAISDVFQQGNQIDIRGITKGKGFQGTVKRFGAHIRQHKAEKTKRGIATLGTFTPSRVAFTVAQSGKMGYHQRTEFNKQIIKIGTDLKEINPSSGLNKYGLIKNNYLLVKGSIVGPQKRALFITPAQRPNHKIVKDAPEVKYLSN